VHLCVYTCINRLVRVCVNVCLCVRVTRTYDRVWQSGMPQHYTKERNSESDCIALCSAHGYWLPALQVGRLSRTVDTHPPHIPRSPAKSAVYQHSQLTANLACVEAICHKTCVIMRTQGCKAPTFCIHTHACTAICIYTHTHTHIHMQPPPPLPQAFTPAVPCLCCPPTTIYIHTHSHTHTHTQTYPPPSSFHTCSALSLLSAYDHLHPHTHSHSHTHTHTHTHTRKHTHPPSSFHTCSALSLLSALLSMLRLLLPPRA